MATGSRWGWVESLAPLRGSRCEHLVALVEFGCRSRTPCAPLWGSGVSQVVPFGSGSWVFAAPPSTFSRRRVGPRGLPSGACRADDVRAPCPPRLRSSFRALLLRWAWALLSWLRPLPPLHRRGLARPLPGPLAGPLRPDHDHVSGPVPPPWFCTTLAASSARASRACFVPLPVRGSPCFGLGLPCGRLRSSSRRGSYPSKNAPRRQPYCVTAALASLSSPPLQFPALPSSVRCAIARAAPVLGIDGRSSAVSGGCPPSSARHLRRVSPTGWLSLRPSAPRSARVGL
jgi:hypothetical protein